MEALDLVRSYAICGHLTLITKSIFKKVLCRWSKINASGDWPEAREGHSSAIIRNNYIMIYGGLDESENLLENMYLLDLRNSFWHKVDSIGSKPTKRDSQTCTQINNVCYIFGGQVII